jgi:hypothetical protein
VVVGPPGTPDLRQSLKSQMFALQSSPIMVRVVEEAPVESTTVADVLIGAIGLTGLLIVVAVLCGLAFGAVLIGVKKMRERRGTAHVPDSEALKIT